MSHETKGGRDYDWGSGPEGGLGTMHGPLGSPQDPCPYDAQPGGGPSIKGGETQGPFASYQQSASPLPIVGRDGLAATPTASGAIETPMSTSTAMPMGGPRPSDGTGPNKGGGSSISTPWSGPFGNEVK